MIPTIRLGILTLLWRRYWLSRTTMSWYADLEIDGIELVPVAVGSEGLTSQKIANDMGYEYVEHPNRPFSSKHIAGLERLRELDVDAVIKIGSDDLFDVAYLERVRDELKLGADYIEHGSIYFYHLASNQAFYTQSSECGDGRVMARSLLDRIDWEVWEPGKQRSVDQMQTASCRPAAENHVRIEDIREEGLVGMDCKSQTNIWSYDYLRSNMREVEDVDGPAILQDRFSPTIAGRLISWRPSSS